MAIADRELMLMTAPVIVDPAVLAAESRRWEAEVLRTLREAAALSTTPKSETVEQLRSRTERFDEALASHHEATQALYISELCRHFPAFAPAFQAVWEHVRDEMSRQAAECCSLLEASDAR